MATVDRRNGHLVVRVVYDGPSGAGKSSNLKQLVQTFSPQRRGELFSPGPVDRATAYFDWLHLNGGVVGGYPLRAQLVTTPGRGALSRRRWQLVEDADVIVFVCESIAGRAMREAKLSLDLLRARLAEKSLAPQIIVQANKQDLISALPPAAVAAALGLAPDHEVIAASAREGSGVRETVVRAIRGAASLAERSIVARGADALSDTEDGPHLLARLDGSALLRSLTEPGDQIPPFPDEDVASGWVWPDRAGRRQLRTLGRALAAGAITRVQAGAYELAFRAGPLHLTTSRAFRREDVDAARAELEARARACVRSGAEQVAATTLVLAGSPGSPIWLWTIEAVAPAPFTRSGGLAT